MLPRGPDIDAGPFIRPISYSARAAAYRRFAAFSGPTVVRLIYKDRRPSSGLDPSVTLIAAPTLHWWPEPYRSVTHVNSGLTEAVRRSFPVNRMLAYTGDQDCWKASCRSGAIQRRVGALKRASTAEIESFRIL
jgi:hypothetical protein